MATGTLLAPSVERIRGVDVERALFRTDYHRAEGLIDVYEAGILVRRCRFLHVPAKQVMRVHCAVDNITYLGRGEHGCIVHADGSRFDAVGACAPRDIPNWLLCPSLAPIWGRDGEEWDADTSGILRLRDGAVTVPLRTVSPRQKDGYAEVVWPGAYLRRLVFGDEQYLLRELTWQPTGA